MNFLNFQRWRFFWGYCIYLEDRAPWWTDTWLIAMVIVFGPLRIGLWDPFRIAYMVDDMFRPSPGSLVKRCLSWIFKAVPWFSGSTPPKTNMSPETGTISVGNTSSNGYQPRIFRTHVNVQESPWILSAPKMFSNVLFQFLIRWRNGSRSCSLKKEKYAQPFKAHPFAVEYIKSGNHWHI